MPEPSRKLGDELARLLHSQCMKAMGFKKQGKNFSRVCDGHDEKIGIQGNPWNSKEEPWHCYVNVAVRIHGIPTVREGGNVHAAGRLEGLCPAAPHAYDLTSENLAATAQELGAWIQQACKAMPEALVAVRQRAMEGWYSPLPVPETWLQPQKTDAAEAVL